MKTPHPTLIAFLALTLGMFCGNLLRAEEPTVDPKFHSGILHMYENPETDDLLDRLDAGITWTEDWPDILAEAGIDFETASVEEIQAYRERTQRQQLAIRDTRWTGQEDHPIYEVYEISVVDGDTVDVLMEYHGPERIRLASIDTHERFTPEGRAATAYLAELIGDGTEITIKIDDQPRTFGRLVGTLFRGRANLNEQIALAKIHTK